MFRVARAIALALLVAGCGSTPPNVVLVVVDTLRRDHVGTYGYERPTTPFIDSLAAEGLVFERAVAQAPWTAPSMASLWTSRYPSEVGGTVVPNDDGVNVLEWDNVLGLSEEPPTLAGILADAGYRTMAVVPNAWAIGLDLGRGFAVQRHDELDAKALTDAAIAEVDAALDAAPSAPFLLWLQYLDVHEPLDPPEPYRSRYSTIDGAPHTIMHTGWDWRLTPDPSRPEVQAFRSHKIALYDGALTYIDDQLRRLVTHLKERGVGESTVVIVASDHGEEFWEHAEFGKAVHLDPRMIWGFSHGHSLFGELTDVPLVLWGPGIPHARIESTVRNIDVTPTILALAGIPVPASMRGIDLVAAARRDVFPVLPAFSEGIGNGAEAHSLQSNGYKLIRYTRSRTGQRDFLFHRSTDPGEHHDVSAQLPDRTTKIGRRLDRLRASLVPAPANPAEIDEDTRKRLEALGYL